MEIKDKRKRIAVDIDGTLTRKGYFPNIFEITPTDMAKIYKSVKPDTDMIKIVNSYYKNGYIVYLFTSRSDLHERITKKWLDKYKVKYHYFIMNKPYYDIFIDDKAIRPEEIKLWDKNK
jgi:uncharacterized HAD superfamily protein